MATALQDITSPVLNHILPDDRLLVVRDDDAYTVEIGRRALVTQTAIDVESKELKVVYESDSKFIEEDLSSPVMINEDETLAHIYLTFEDAAANEECFGYENGLRALYVYTLGTNNQFTKLSGTEAVGTAIYLTDGKDNATDRAMRLTTKPTQANLETGKKAISIGYITRGIDAAAGEFEIKFDLRRTSQIITGT